MTILSIVLLPFFSWSCALLAAHCKFVGMLLGFFVVLSKYVAVTAGFSHMISQVKNGYCLPKDCHKYDCTHSLQQTVLTTLLDS